MLVLFIYSIVSCITHTQQFIGEKYCYLYLLLCISMFFCCVTWYEQQLIRLRASKLGYWLGIKDVVLKWDQTLIHPSLHWRLRQNLQGNFAVTNRDYCSISRFIVDYRCKSDYPLCWVRCKDDDPKLWRDTLLLRVRVFCRMCLVFLLIFYELGWYKLWMDQLNDPWFWQFLLIS